MREKLTRPRHIVAVARLQMAAAGHNQIDPAGQVDHLAIESDVVRVGRQHNFVDTLGRQIVDRGLNLRRRNRGVDRRTAVDHRAGWRRQAGEVLRGKTDDADLLAIDRLDRRWRNPASQARGFLETRKRQRISVPAGEETIAREVEIDRQIREQRTHPRT